ncbi:MAG: hypothetical protein LBC73_09125 [Oscillospiraceae bacterium]|jgi:hypothetical protein|nr:hypothetical protein [Oscillospiraceae bacterium]
MTNLLFCIIKEFNTLYSGKIFQVKILSGNMSVGEEICLYGVVVLGHKGNSNKITAEVKQIRHLNSENDFEKDRKGSLFAEQGDIITINLKNCRHDGKRIDKSDFILSNVTLGVYLEAKCDFVDVINLKLLNHNKSNAKFIKKLNDSLERKDSKKRFSACNVSLLWFGKKVSSELINIYGVNAEIINMIVSDGNANYNFINDMIISYRALNNYRFPIPNNVELRKYIERIIIKDTHSTKQMGRGKKGEPIWRYYPSNVLFDDSLVHTI